MGNIEEKNTVVKVDAKALAMVKRGLAKESKVAKELRTVYVNFGAVNAEAIESIGGKLGKDGKYQGYDTKALNKWRLESFPTMVNDGKLKDGALFSHAIAMFLQWSEVQGYLESQGLDHLYRPDTIMKRFAAFKKAETAKAELANETEEETATRERQETLDAIDNLLAGVKGPLAKLAKYAKNGDMPLDKQRELAFLLIPTFDELDSNVKHTAQVDYQEELAAKHEEIRDAKAA